MKYEKSEMLDDEINLKDIVNFFKRNQKQIALWCFSGLLLSAVFVVIAPKKYEARWQIRMAQFSNNSNSNSSSEEPVALIQRLREPTTYPAGVRLSCGKPEDGDLGNYLDGALQVQAIKNLPTAVDMKFSATSYLQARKCAETIVAMIVDQQRALIEEGLAGHRQLLAQYKQALLEEQQQLEKMNNAELGNFGYLAKLDKLTSLRTRIGALQEEAFLSQLHPAKLISPIYVPSKPVSPKVGLLMLLGMSLGLMFGVLFASVRENWHKVE